MEYLHIRKSWENYVPKHKKATLVPWLYVRFPDYPDLTL